MHNELLHQICYYEWCDEENEDELREALAKYMEKNFEYTKAVGELIYEKYDHRNLEGFIKCWRKNEPPNELILYLLSKMYKIPICVMQRWEFWYTYKAIGKELSPQTCDLVLLKLSKNTYVDTKEGAKKPRGKPPPLLSTESKKAIAAETTRRRSTRLSKDEDYKPQAGLPSRAKVHRTRSTRSGGKRKVESYKEQSTSEDTQSENEQRYSFRHRRRKVEPQPVPGLPKRKPKKEPKPKKPTRKVRRALRVLKGFDHRILRNYVTQRHRFPKGKPIANRKVRFKRVAGKIIVPVHQVAVLPDRSKKVRSCCRKCALCDAKFKSLRLLNRHTERDHPGHRYQCLEPGCYKDYPSTHSLYIHTCIKHRPARYFCAFPKCRRSFHFKVTFDKHKLMHQGKSKFVCNVTKTCKAAFRYKPDQDKHMRQKHGTGETFDCTVCDYKGESKKLLKQHMDVHSDPKYKCEKCGKKYKSRGGLKYHRDHDDHGKKK